MNKNPTTKTGSAPETRTHVGASWNWSKPTFEKAVTGEARLDAQADKGEQCVYCGKDSWTCEHFEPPILDGSESEGE